MSQNNDIRRQAELLAAETRKTQSAVRKIYWFPDETEVRLVELKDITAPALSGEVEPFFFRPSPQDNLPSPHAIALIRTEEYGKLGLPEGWGTWDDAMELEIG